MALHIYETRTDLSPGVLYHAISDVATWPKWDPDLESVTIDGDATEGARFVLRPKGGPNVKLIVTRAKAPEIFEDVALLFLGRMRTLHRYSVDAAGTSIRIEIETSGLLGWLWDRLVARGQAAGLAASTQAFIAYARGRA
jgi:hypothetical protein